MHTEESLKGIVRERLRGRRFVVVSNREPFIHRWDNGEIVCVQPASGVTTALDPVLRATNGLWVAHGSGDADAQTVDEASRVKVPPERPRYTLKRVWLSEAQEKLYYYGLSNQALWPLCHVVYQRPVFEEAHWQCYKQVNRLFADAVAEEIGSEPAFVFIQDYHLGLLSRMVKQRCPNAITAQFWHIPWPNPEVFRIFPWRQELLESLLDNDILGFHLRYHCLNFVETVDRFLEARVDAEKLAVSYQGALTKVRAFPISVDFEAISAEAATPEVDDEVARLREHYGLNAEFLAVGVDRLDYTKGIPERFRAVDRFLDTCPHYRERFTLFQAGVPTRSAIPQYQQVEAECRALAAQINHKHGTADWRPIVFVERHFMPPALHAIFRMAKVCIVSSLHDGMNLVAKEFVSARADDAGVLVLSSFTGAARQLEDAVLVNPYAVDRFAGAIRQALEMNPEEVRQRMRRMRKSVQRHNIYRWATHIVEKLSGLCEEMEEEAPEDDSPMERLVAAQAGD